jgi:hypothetical protein
MRTLSLLLVLAVAGCGNSVTQESGAAACITANACGILAIGVSACTQVVNGINDPAGSAATKFTPAEVNCIANAGHDCAAAKKCLAGGQTPATCSGNARSCDGNTWQSCTPAAGSGGNSGIQTFDCSSVGQTCVTNNGNTDCGYGTCSPGAPSCVNGDGTPNGNLVQTCNAGILQRTDCTRFDSSCNPSGFTGAHCRGNGQACSATGADTSVRCDGSVLVTCADGQEARYDCAHQNLGCFAGANGNHFDCAAGTECNPNSYTANCVGLKLTFCNKGKVQSVDCGASGFSSCSPNNGGTCGI